MTVNLKDYVDISQSPDLASFERQLVKFASDADFGIATAGLAIDRPGRGPGGSFTSVGNAPAAYSEMAKNMNYGAADPVLAHLKRECCPIAYDQTLYVAAGAAASDLWEFQAAFGFRNGIALAVHLPERKHFLLGFDRERALPADGKKLARMLGSLALLATFAQSAALRLFPAHEPSQVADCAVRLTRRELEVLRWTLDGKTSWEIGQILSVSYDTVLFHLRNCMKKFGVSSKHQAALRAVSSGLLEL